MDPICFIQKSNIFVINLTFIYNQDLLVQQLPQKKKIECSNSILFCLQVQRSHITLHIPTNITNNKIVTLFSYINYRPYKNKSDLLQNGLRKCSYLFTNKMLLNLVCRLLILFAKHQPISSIQRGLTVEVSSFIDLRFSVIS